MIHLTRINDTHFVINAELIELIESSPDTIVSLTNGHKYLVKDTVDDVVNKVVAYKRSIAERVLDRDES